MLPKYRRLVERLAQAGLLKVVCGTDTLGVGVNVPIRTVLFTALSKYDGQRTRLLSAREFHQIAGRAGRAGFDTAGTVVVQAPEHVVENEKALAKAGDDPKKRRKVVRKKPPEGSIGWGEPTYERLVEAEPEPLTSQFRVSHAMLLNVIARPGDAFAAMRHLLEDNDSDRPTQRRLIREAIAIYRSLLAAGVVERLSTPDTEGRMVRLTVDLQENFALNQPLSTFALAALDLLDRESETYALDVVSVIESTLDQPRQVLSAQEHRARGEAVAAMKAEGIEYDERMELLQEVSYPKPLEELLDGRVRDVPAGAPVGGRLRAGPQVGRPGPVRAGDDVRRLRPALPAGPVRGDRAALPGRRVQGAATRPCRTEAKTEELQDLIAWLGELVRQVDSSLLDEWEQLANPGEPVPADGEIEAAPPAVTANPRAFRVLVRNALFRRVELAARRQWDDARRAGRGGRLGRRGLGRGDGAVLRRARHAAHRCRRPRAGAAGGGRAAGALGGSGRSSTTRPATTTGAITAEVDLAESDELGRAAVHVASVERLD